ncbi:MAG: homoserine dehydrogenase [Anaerolineae bacterium]|nr:homoserine dehydrogenase [Anaerolineae bacterium]
MVTVRLALAGVGNVGRGFLELLRDKSALVRDSYGLDLQMVAAADRSGVVAEAAGLDPVELLALKQSGQGVAAYPGGQAGLSAQEMLGLVEADVLLEATLTDLKTGQPGLDLMRAAFERGLHVVSANKGPIVLAYRDLLARAGTAGRDLRFSAAVCGALPTVNIGQRDLVACRIEKIEGIFNSTTNYILGAMTTGAEFETALTEAQRVGVAEADPSLDIEGWDTANKLVILANSVLGYPAQLDEVEVIGIQAITPGALQAASAANRVIKLLALALRRPDGTYRLRVAPTPLPLDHPLARTRGWEMGIVYTTDIMGVQTASVDERGPVPTGAAMLRDVISIYRQRG